MEDNRSSGSLTNAIKWLKISDGRKPGELRGWHIRMMTVVLGVTRRDIANIIKGKTRPIEETSNMAQASLDKAVSDYDRSTKICTPFYTCSQ